jgi:hypothetical protein
MEQQSLDRMARGDSGRPPAIQDVKDACQLKTDRTGTEWVAMVAQAYADAWATTRLDTPAAVTEFAEAASLLGEHQPTLVTRCLERVRDPVHGDVVTTTSAGWMPKLQHGASAALLHAVFRHGTDQQVDQALVEFGCCADRTSSLSGASWYSVDLQHHIDARVPEPERSLRIRAAMAAIGPMTEPYSRGQLALSRVLFEIGSDALTRHWAEAMASGHEPPERHPRSPTPMPLDESPMSRGGLLSRWCTAQVERDPSAIRSSPVLMAALANNAMSGILPNATTPIHPVDREPLVRVFALVVQDEKDSRS